MSQESEKPSSQLTPEQPNNSNDDKDQKIAKLIQQLEGIKARGKKLESILFELINLNSHSRYNNNNVR